MQPAAARSKLAGRLRPAQQQQADDSQLRIVEVKIAVARVAETLDVFLGAALEVLIGAHEMLAFEFTDRVLDLALGEIHHRIAGGFLVAGAGQRIECQRVLVRRHDRFFDQASDDAGFLVSELWQHGVSSSRVRGGGTPHTVAQRLMPGNSAFARPAWKLAPIGRE